ncbi:hypothetical protein [Citrobacter sp. BDA59-3]|nr:hypothetical protein [Citrobacter sp. BDA59-3]
MTPHWRLTPLHYQRCAKKVFLQVEDPVTLADNSATRNSGSRHPA